MKRIIVIAVCFALITAFIPTCALAAEGDGIIKGDLLGKGKPTLGSFSLLGKYLLHKKDLDDYQKLAADMNDDGKISMTDFAILGKLLLNGGVSGGVQEAQDQTPQTSGNTSTNSGNMSTTTPTPTPTPTVAPSTSNGSGSNARLPGESVQDFAKRMAEARANGTGQQNQQYDNVGTFRTYCTACNTDMTGWTNAQLSEHLSYHLDRGESGGYYTK